MSASLMGRLGASAFRLSTSTVSMSLAGSRFSNRLRREVFDQGNFSRGKRLHFAAVHGDCAEQRIVLAQSDADERTAPAKVDQRTTCRIASPIGFFSHGVVDVNASFSAQAGYHRGA